MYKEYITKDTRIKNDCFIRALENAENETYKNIRQQLYSQYGGDFRELANVCKFLIKKGYKLSIPAAKDYGKHHYYFMRHDIDIEKLCQYSNAKKRYTVANFAESHPEGTYIVITRGHAIPIVNGTYIDTWDSGRNQVKLVFKK